MKSLLTSNVTMISNERNATSQSTTSEESVPLAKRRRIEVPTKAESENDMHLSTPLSQGYNMDNAPQLHGAGVHAHHQAMSSDSDYPKAKEESKQDFALDMLQSPNIIITIECGVDLETHYHIPLFVLSAESQKQIEIFCQAEGLRKGYVGVKALRKRVKALYPLLELHAPHIRHTDRCREKAMALILEALNDFPIPMYQAGVAKRLAEATNSVFCKNDLWTKPPGKKLDKGLHPMNDIKGRLHHLQDIAVYTVLERLDVYLHDLKGLEKEEASKSAVKAAAQQRIILPSEDPATVEVLVEWLYKSKSTLTFTSVTHLYAIHSLADKLGITHLAAECMALLTSATSRILRRAKSEGVTLKDLLDVCTRGSAHQQSHDREPDAHSDTDLLSSPRVVGEVFKIALRTPDPPLVLQDLVANAIAESEDTALLNQLLPTMNLEMRGNVTVAMLHNIKSKREPSHPQAHSTASRSASVKPETSHEKSQRQDVKQERVSVHGPTNKTEMCNEEADTPAAT
ncbi:uncharacterized protein CC84DRAFT_359196 [Paraphaeosphaeria sporulosa]|uniref:BTB domain-containing protein n=1 Tax=Paraphaeosphaeria sporulosa TaxID=1460663 RepID=A0A177C045_9PLEO|nr:uncharacterized protein CC84DRAFT_359196 [Paraphaeosphaeria sporulosa]OAG00077.1 hypothetical protein CC84DRAFT_359196 [Paraphaeosphaeria sporulosa]